MGFCDEGRDFACAECFRVRMRVSRLVEDWGHDVTRDLLRGYVDVSAGHLDATVADFLPRLSMALRTLTYRDITVEPRRACEYALHLLGEPAMTRHGRSYNLQVWADCLCEQLDVRGGVTDRYLSDLAALASEMEHERELRRHRANDEAIARRAAEMDGKSFESDGHVIHPAASVQEIIDEPTPRATAWRPSSTGTHGARPRFGSCAAPTAPTSPSSPSRCATGECVRRSGATTAR
jgi:hypothetical protein